MAIITILLSCTLGAMAGLIQLVFLGASFGQAFVTYLAISVVLPASVIGAGLVISLFRAARASNQPVFQKEMETWHDWQTEEAMEADSVRFAEGRVVDAKDDRRRWTHTQTHDPDHVQTAATAYSARRAGKV